MNETFTEITSEIQPGDPYTQPFRVILRRNDRGEYVTHCENLEPGSLSPKPQRDTYWGHYFPGTPEGKTQAIADYSARCAKYRLAPLL